MEDYKSKVYVLVDEQNRILRVEGGYTMSNIKDPEKWTLIDEGIGDRYNLCQSNYLDGGLYTEDGIYRYKLVDNNPVPRTDEEIEFDRESIPESKPTIEERVNVLELDSVETKEALEMILSGVTE